MFRASGNDTKQPFGRHQSYLSLRRTAEQTMVRYDTVLLTTDGSKGSRETIDHAVSLARDHDATLHVLYVVDRRRYMAADKDTQDDVIQALEEEGELAVEDASVAAEEAGLRDGIPHKTILDYTEEVDADVVVMGTHGRTGRDRVANLGSVTERVVKSSEVPVFVIRIE